MIAVTWFKNPHEQRNYWLRFGLMRLHSAGEIVYREAELAECIGAGFDPAVAAHEHRHTSAIAVSDNDSNRGRTTRAIVDSEDSFFCMANMMPHADRYFCAGYNGAFFRDKVFEPPYPWLEPDETAFYRQRADFLIANFGDHFDRVRPFVPIGPDLGRKQPIGPLARKLRNAHDKAARALGRSHEWRFVLEDFEHRYADLLGRRNTPAAHDVVLLDTLWGWPRHREALHRRLQDMSADGRDIHSRLNWAEPSHWDGSDAAPLNKADFPITTGPVDNYEAMLAASRLGVFASGFHWGWRNIMTVALMWGLPINADRLFLEPWFDMDRFVIGWNDHADWHDLPAALAAIDDSERAQIMAHNQAAFDELLAPECVARYFVEAALA